MPKSKGGRGHAAPYDTKLMRVPVPLADQVRQLIERYQDFITTGGEAYAPPPLLDAIASDKVVNEFEELQQRCMQLEGRLSSQEIEINELHQKNGVLNKDVEMLLMQLLDAANPVNEFELKEAKATAEYWQARAEDEERQHLKAVNNLETVADKAVNNLHPLNESQLAKRFGLSRGAIRKQRHKLATFGDWTRGKDPSGIAWEYDERSKLFQPLKFQ